MKKLILIIAIATISLNSAFAFQVNLVAQGQWGDTKTASYTNINRTQVWYRLQMTNYSGNPAGVSLVQGRYSDNSWFQEAMGYTVGSYSGSFSKTGKTISSIYIEAAVFNGQTVAYTSIWW